MIQSSPEESLILTSAHNLKLERVPPLDSFAPKIMVDLFDGKLQGEHSAQVRFDRHRRGKVVDIDFELDRRADPDPSWSILPASRVVPKAWQPEAGMKMLTMGCSEGNDPDGLAYDRHLS